MQKISPLICEVLTLLGYVTDPAAPAGIVRRELPEPPPREHDVVVEVAAYSINRGELALIERRPDGWTPGQDVAGVIVVAAADGTGPAIGTRVVGLADQGGWSERVAIPSHRVAALPHSVSFTEAAALPVAGLTALRGLRTGGSLLSSRVLITGASGGVGTFAVQLARIAGALVTAQVSGPARIAAVSALGAVEVRTEIGADAGPFQLVLDGVGGPILTAAVRRLAPGGVATAYGVASGRRSDIAFYDFAEGAPGARLEGFFIYSSGEETFGRDLAALALLIAEGKLVPQIGAPRNWSATPEAVTAMRRHEATGKVVLVRD
ncbi:MAG TPA: zinc-binding dehydrogenase [Streptosporangiaceae bacterium]|nr:zinc-binding dehydrogenase [Streptosporangiaceae bacterium]